MPRIVKEGAKPFETDSGDLLYGADNFIEIKKGWRPKNWGDIVYNKSCIPFGCKGLTKKDFDEQCPTCAYRVGFEAGFDACIEVMDLLSEVK